MTSVDENYYINVAEVMENETTNLTYLEQQFIDLYNNTHLPIRKIKQQLDLSDRKYWQMRLELEPYLEVRGKGNRKHKARLKPNNYSLNHTTMSFDIRYRGEYFACVKTERQARRLVELLRECGWDKSRVKELKRRAYFETKCERSGL